jgi:hypothetical protein
MDDPKAVKVINCARLEILYEYANLPAKWSKLTNSADASFL